MKLVLYILLLLCLTSCDKWLDVDPMSQIKSEELFKTEEGYHKALIGIYINMAKPSLYGGDLTLSTLDVMAQNYNTPLVEQGHSYERIAKYEYDNFKVQDRLDGIWSDLYNEIANCNGILERIDFQKELFSEVYYTVLKGEVLALRAMFHFDLLRLYVPACSKGLDVEAIPYVRTFGAEARAFLTTREVLAYILHDLLVARDLLKLHDPIIDENGEQNQSNPYLEKRQSRMNYYAVTALLARVYLYMGNDLLAYTYAKEVYDAERFALIGQKELAQLEAEKESLTFRKEHLFSIHVNGMQSNITPNLFFTDPLSRSLAVDEDELKALYAKNTTDIRYQYWFSSGGGGYMALEKYRYGEYIPLVKFSEVILILAETAGKIEEAASFLNELKMKRQSPSELITDFNILEKLEEEYRKEFIGEGQMFYFYKRIGKKKLPGNIPMSDEMYSLPIPMDEIEFKPLN